MSSFEVRPFRRSDRDQVTALVNAHAGAVVPGMSVSASSVLSALERRPAEFIEDPWVSERVTLVAEQDGRIVAAAHLLRYFSDERAGAGLRDAGEIHWLVFWPDMTAGNPSWPGATGAAEALAGACVRVLEEWGVTRQHAGGELPVPGVYGVPEQWPHVSAVYEGAGFAHTGHVEVIYLARVADLRCPGGVQVPGLSVRRTVGTSGTRLSAMLGPEAAGFIEVEMVGDGERWSRHGGWAEVGNLRVAEGYRRRGVATWLLGQAADWLDVARADRLLDYAWLERTDQGGLDYAGYRAFLQASRFREISRTRRGWTRSGHDQHPR